MLLINRNISDYEETYKDGTADLIPRLESGKDLASEAEVRRAQRELIGDAIAVPVTEAVVQNSADFEAPQ